MEGKRGREKGARFSIPLPLHHPLRGRSPSPSKLGEDLKWPGPSKLREDFYNAGPLHYRKRKNLPTFS